MATTWLCKILSTTTLSEDRCGTNVEIRWTVWSGTPEERQTFEAAYAHDGVTKGWNSTLDLLATHQPAPPGTEP